MDPAAPVELLQELLACRMLELHVEDNPVAVSNHGKWRYLTDIMRNEELRWAPELSLACSNSIRSFKPAGKSSRFKMIVQRGTEHVFDCEHKLSSAVLGIWLWSKLFGVESLASAQPSFTSNKHAHQHAQLLELHESEHSTIDSNFANMPAVTLHTCRRFCHLLLSAATGYNCTLMCRMWHRCLLPALRLRVSAT